MNFVKLLLIGMALSLFWLWGVATVKYRVFPYSIVKPIYNYMINAQTHSAHNELEMNRYPEDFIDNAKVAAKSYFDYVKKNSAEIREEIIKENILPQSLITLLELNNNEKKLFQKNNSIENVSKIFGVTYYGITHHGVFEKSDINKKSINKLLIYSQGHGWIVKANPYFYKYFKIIKELFKKEGFDILALSMTGRGFNAGKVIFPTAYGQTEFGSSRAKYHQVYSYYKDEKFPSIKPLSLILSGNYYLIQNLIKDYDQVVMMGNSGGGWYTTMYSALIPEIQISYSFGGSFPKNFGILSHKYAGDWEHIYPSIWKNYDYWHFYFLSLIDNKKNLNRKHHLVYNDKDPCCYNNPYAKYFKQVSDSLKIPGLNVSILKHDDHGIKTDFVSKQLEKLPN